MSARDFFCLATVACLYLAMGGGVYLIAYGEPSGFPLSLAVVLVAWPLALVWWSLWWILVGVVCLFAFLGVLRVWDDL